MRKKKKRWKGWLEGYAMMAPFYIIFLTIYLMPIFETVWNSLTDLKMFEKANFIGLRNFVNVFKDAVFIQSLKNTLVYVVFNLAGIMVIGLALAMLVNSKLVKSGPMRAAFFLPHIASMVSVSIIWIWLFDPTKGYLNQILLFFGAERQDWLGNPKLALPSIIFMSIWKGVGYNMIVNLSGLQSIPAMYYEAARVDGANRWQVFRSITFPLLAPTTFFLFITGMINSFNMFEQVNVMTNGGPLNSTTTVVHQIYTRAFLKYQMGYASAESVLLLLLIGVFIFLSFRFGGKADDVEL